MKWAFTFGVQYNLGQNYVIVEADTEADARRIFVEARHKACIEHDTYPADGHLRWAMQYPVDDAWVEQVERYGLTEAPIDSPIWVS